MNPITIKKTIDKNKRYDTRKNIVKNQYGPYGNEWLDTMEKVFGTFSCGFGRDFSDGNPTPPAVLFTRASAFPYYYFLFNNTAVEINNNIITAGTFINTAITTALGINSQFALSYLNDPQVDSKLEIYLTTTLVTDANETATTGFIKIDPHIGVIRKVTAGTTTLYPFNSPLTSNDVLSFTITTTNQLSFSVTGDHNFDVPNLQIQVAAGTGAVNVFLSIGAVSLSTELPRSNAIEFIYQ